MNEHNSAIYQSFIILRCGKANEEYVGRWGGGERGGEAEVVGGLGLVRISVSLSGAVCGDRNCGWAREMIPWSLRFI